MQVLYNFTNLLISNNENTTSNLTTSVPSNIITSDNSQVDSIVKLTIGISIGVLASCWLCCALAIYYHKFKSIEPATATTVDPEAQVTIEHRLTVH